MEFFREHPYDRLGAFTYSPEDGTPAAEMEDQIDEKIKAKRLDTLMRRQQKVSLAANRRRIGTVCEALVDEVKGGVAYCRSYAEAPEVDGFIRVKLEENSSLEPGDFITVRITDATRSAAEISAGEGTEYKRVR